MDLPADFIAPHRDVLIATGETMGDHDPFYKLVEAQPKYRSADFRKSYS